MGCERNTPLQLAEASELRPSVEPVPTPPSEAPTVRLDLAQPETTVRETTVPGPSVPMPTVPATVVPRPVREFPPAVPDELVRIAAPPVVAEDDGSRWAALLPALSSLGAFKRAGADGVLIGTAVARTPDPVGWLRSLRGALLCHQQTA